MCSYNAINGVPSCANRELLGDLLRGEWNFTGFVVSDCCKTTSARRQIVSENFMSFRLHGIEISKVMCVFIINQPIVIIVQQARNIICTVYLNDIVKIDI